MNSFFITNVRTDKSATRVTFSLNNTALFKVNVHALFMMNNTTFKVNNIAFRLNNILFSLNVVLFILNNAWTLTFVIHTECGHVSCFRLSSRLQWKMSFHLNPPLYMHIYGFREVRNGVKHTVMASQPHSRPSRFWQLVSWMEQAWWIEEVPFDNNSVEKC